MSSAWPYFPLFQRPKANLYPNDARWRASRRTCDVQVATTSRLRRDAHLFSACLCGVRVAARCNPCPYISMRIWAIAQITFRKGGGGEGFHNRNIGQRLAQLHSATNGSANSFK